jgi:hypothetical protein
LFDSFLELVFRCSPVPSENFVPRYKESFGIVKRMTADHTMSRIQYVDGTPKNEKTTERCAFVDVTHKYGRRSVVKTTLEIPESLFRRAKTTAARQGRTLKQLVQEALSEKITRLDGASRQQKPWMVLAGGLKHLRSENGRIERLIKAEFENIEQSAFSA